MLTSPKQSINIIGELSLLSKKLPSPASGGGCPEGAGEGGPNGNLDSAQTFLSPPLEPPIFSGLICLGEGGRRPGEGIESGHFGLI
jgi:hypothetical protein